MKANIPMKKLWSIIDFFDVKLITVIMVVLFIIFGQIKQLILLFMIAFIHELCHFFACYFLGVKTNKIEILPFGVTLVIDDAEKLSSIKQIIVYLAGPLSMFINFIWIIIFYKISFINEINYDFLVRINLVTFFGNLMPIYPLDGYVVLKGILQIYLPYKKALQISIILSIIFLLIFVIYNFISFQPLVTVFLIIEQIKNIKNYKMLYKNFLIYKSKIKKQKKYKVINDYLLYKDVNNYKIEKDKVLNDADIAAKELKKFI